jgi:hypothetical protein
VLAFLLGGIGVSVWRWVSRGALSSPAATRGESQNQASVDAATLRMTVALAAIGLVVLLPNFIGPWLAGSHYPAPRQLTYWPALLSLGLAGFGAMAWRRSGRVGRPIGALAGVLLLVLAGWFVGQLNVGGYHGFRGNRATRAMVEQIQRLADHAPGDLDTSQPIRIGGDWRIASAATFYRNRDMPDRMSEFDRLAYDQFTAERCGEMDYMLLSTAAPVDPRPLGFVTVFEDPVGNRLAVSRQWLTAGPHIPMTADAGSDSPPD